MKKHKGCRLLQSLLSHCRGIKENKSVDDADESDDAGLANEHTGLGPLNKQQGDNENKSISSNKKSPSRRTSTGTDISVDIEVIESTVPLDAQMVRSKLEVRQKNKRAPSTSHLRMRQQASDEELHHFEDSNNPVVIVHATKDSSPMQSNVDVKPDIHESRSMNEMAVLAHCELSSHKSIDTVHSADELLCTSVIKHADHCDPVSPMSLLFSKNFSANESPLHDRLTRDGSRETVSSGQVVDTVACETSHYATDRSTDREQGMMKTRENTEIIADETVKSLDMKTATDVAISSIKYVVSEHEKMNELKHTSCLLPQDSQCAIAVSSSNSRHLSLFGNTKNKSVMSPDVFKEVHTTQSFSTTSSTFVDCTSMESSVFFSDDSPDKLTRSGASIATSVNAICEKKLVGSAGDCDKQAPRVKNAESKTVDNYTSNLRGRTEHGAYGTEAENVSIKTSSGELSDKPVQLEMPKAKLADKCVDDVDDKTPLSPEKSCVDDKGKSTPSAIMKSASPDQVEHRRLSFKKPAPVTETNYASVPGTATKNVSDNHGKPLTSPTAQIQADWAKSETDAVTPEIGDKNGNVLVDQWKTVESDMAGRNTLQLTPTGGQMCMIEHLDNSAVLAETSRNKLSSAGRAMSLDDYRKPPVSKKLSAGSKVLPTTANDGVPAWFAKRKAEWKPEEIERIVSSRTVNKPVEDDNQDDASLKRDASRSSVRDIVRKLQSQQVG